MATPLNPASERDLPSWADPVAANLDSVTPVAPTVASIPTTRNVLMAGWVSGATATVVCLLLRLIGGLFRAEFLIVFQPSAGVDDLLPLPWWSVVLIPLAVGLAGCLIGAVFLGVRGCQRWVFWLGTLGLLVSLAAPWLQPTPPVTWPTKLWLAVMHIATWAIVVPQVARVVGDSDPRVTASYREPGTS